MRRRERCVQVVRALVRADRRSVQLFEARRGCLRRNGSERDLQVLLFSNEHLRRPID